MSEKCFCHFNGFQVKDAVARNGLAELNEMIPLLKNAIIEQNKGKELRFWVGTIAEYEAIEEKAEDYFYIVTDDTSGEEIAEAIKSVTEKVDPMPTPYKVLFNGSVTTTPGQYTTISAPGIGDYSVIRVNGDVYTRKNNLPRLSGNSVFQSVESIITYDDMVVDGATKKAPMKTDIVKTLIISDNNTVAIAEKFDITGDGTQTFNSYYGITHAYPGGGDVYLQFTDNTSFTVESIIGII